MTGLSRRERRALARDNARDRKRAMKAERRRQDAERRAAQAQMAARDDTERTT